MATKSDNSTTDDSPFANELARTEASLREWQVESTRCRGELQEWDGLESVVDDRKRAHQRLRTQIRVALRAARNATRWQFSILSSLWSVLRFRWLSTRLWMLRLKIVLIAFAIAINRLLVWSRRVLIPLALLWVAIELVRFLWSVGFQFYERMVRGLL